MWITTCLDTLYEFCSCWKLEVNNSKSKVLIFNSNGKSFLNHFMYNGNVIETVNSYSYLGIMLKCNGSFNLAMSTLAEKARKAYFKIKNTIGLNNPCKLLEKLFDSLILPISLYCCEIWGLESALKCKESDPYELLHTNFMKEILGVHCKTPNAACRSELARQSCRTKTCINYLDHVISSKDTLSHDILKATWKLNVWIRNIISCINRLGFPI